MRKYFLMAASFVLIVASVAEFTPVKAATKCSGVCAGNSDCASGCQCFPVTLVGVCGSIAPINPSATGRVR